jgi:predicted dehydrogenase
VKTAIIGAGRQGKRRAAAIRESGDEIVWVVDKDITLARSFAASFNCRASKDWHEAISDRSVDVVVICTPNNLHARISIGALKSGKHVLVEKPLARNPDEALQVLKAAKNSSAKLKCGFNLRYHPALKETKRVLDEGVLGTILYLRCRYGITGRPDYEKDWRMKPTISGGGQLMDQGIHVLDLFRWFSGDFTQVFGLTATMHWKIEPLEDNAFALLRTESGQVALMHVSWTEWKNLFSFEAFGEKGYAKVDGLGGSYGSERLTVGPKDLSRPFRENVTDFKREDKSWLGEWRHFVHCIKENSEYAGNAYDGWAAIRLAYAIYKSSRTGRVVKLTW